METFAIEVDVNELFFWDPLLFEGTVFEINRVVLLIFFASILCVSFFWLGARRGSLVPRGIQTVAESAYMFVRNRIAVDVIGPQEGPRYAPYLTALFFFIFFNNLLEIVPGINFPTTSRMAIPFFLAIVTWFIFNIVGVVKQGVGHYLKGTLFPPGVPKGMYVLLTPIEAFSVFFIRPLTLMLRLLANMMAGHVLLTIFFLFTHMWLVTDIKIGSFIGIGTLAIAAILILFEFLVISIQAYIFTMLTAFYIAEATHGHAPQDVEAGAHEDARRAVPEHEVEGLKPQAA